MNVERLVTNYALQAFCIDLNCFTTIDHAPGVKDKGHQKGLWSLTAARHKLVDSPYCSAMQHGLY